MTITPRRLIYDAYRQLGVLRPGQNVSEDSVDDAMRALSDMLDSWQTERLMVYAVTGTNYTLPSAGGSYTMGPGGTLALTAPLRVESASWVQAQGSHTGIPAQPVAVLTLNEYRGGRSGLYFDGKYPLVTMYVRPSALGGETLILYAWEPLQSFSANGCCADTAYNFPAGYAQALRWNLACQLYPSAIIQQKIPSQVYQLVEAKAAESKGAIKSFHSSPPPVMDASDGGALGCGCGYNIRTDGYY